MSIENTLAERGSRYGSFTGHASITQTLKRTMASSPNWPGLPDDMREALDMVAHKIGRILNGDPNYADSWHDIIGYVRLIEKRLETNQTSVLGSGLEELNSGQANQYNEKFAAGQGLRPSRETVPDRGQKSRTERLEQSFRERVGLRESDSSCSGTSEIPGYQHQ